METFNFSPNSKVPSTIPREPMAVVTMNSWTFSAKPTTPHAHKFKVILHGLRWFENSDGTFDTTSSPTINARLLEQFYDSHERWNPFNWTHPHLGAKVVRFDAPVNVPPAIANSGGLIDPVEITFIEHDPGY